MSIGSGCKIHLRSSELPRGPLIVKVSRHLTAVIDGVLLRHPRLLARRNAVRVWLLFAAVANPARVPVRNLQKLPPTSNLQGNPMKPFEAL